MGYKWDLKVYIFYHIGLHPNKYEYYFLINVVIFTILIVYGNQALPTYALIRTKLKMFPIKKKSGGLEKIGLYK